MNQLAGGNQIWVCQCCGKTSEDKYGIEGKHSYGWDVSCVVNAVLCWKGRLTMSGGRVSELPQTALVKEYVP